MDPCLLDFNDCRGVSDIVALEFKRSWALFKALMDDLGALDNQLGGVDARGAHAFLSPGELHKVHALRPDLHLKPRHVLVRADVEDQLQLCIDTMPSRLGVVVISRMVVVSEAEMIMYSEYLAAASRR